MFVLLISADTQLESGVRESLGGQGWWVTRVGDRQTAIRTAADHQPSSVVVDSAIEDVEEVVRTFGLRAGGPGVVLLAAGAEGEDTFAWVEAGADEVLGHPPRTERLVEAVERLAAVPQQNIFEVDSLFTGKQMDSEELFGDILRELEGMGAEGDADGEAQTAVAPAATPEEPSAPRVEPPELPDVDGFFDVDEASPEEIEQFEQSGAGSMPDEPPPVADGPRADGEMLGQYRLEERIAVGGMAEVWRASMEGVEGFSKRVAIKKILPHLAENEQFVTMFVDEAKLVAQLSHENLVDIYDLGRSGKDLFIAMEYIEGDDLRAILNRSRRAGVQIPEMHAVYIGCKIARALEYAHACKDGEGNPLGLVHRDVSPRNIMIRRDGQVILCDFGVAKAVSSMARTEIGALKGKIQYMSPEQAYGARVDGRSDVFSLGSILFELVTGRRVFVEDAEIPLLEAVRQCRIEPPQSLRPELSSRAAEIISRSLKKDPNRRYLTAGEMRRELEELLLTYEPPANQEALAQWLLELPETAQAAAPAAPADSDHEAPLEEDSAESPAVADEVELPSEVATSTADYDEVYDSSPSWLMRNKFWIGVGAGLLLALVIGVLLRFAGT